uniref:Bromo domain-containing protein n=1 Tax=Haemonchus contortus TaxID=6289 RepID=A0A7I4XXM5_HAECO
VNGEMSVAIPTELPGSRRESDERTKLELLVLIERYLSSSPCKKAAAVLRREIEENGLLPFRYDYRGNTHSRTYRETITDLASSAPSLLHLIERLSVLADSAVPPSVRGLPIRLINNKRNCLLRTPESATRKDFSSRMLACQPVPNHIINSVRLSTCREFGTRVSRARLPGIGSLDQMERHYRVLGHLSMVYCVTFDRTGNYVLTGADDNLIKVWDVHQGLLRYTYRGHSAEVADVSVSYCNQMIASGSVDKSIRVWSLATGETLQVFHIHTAVVARVKFLPFVDHHKRYLVSCALDCKVVFYPFNEDTKDFDSSDIVVFDEREVVGARIISLCHSPSGQWVVVGDTHCYLRLFRVSRGPDGGVTKFTDICAHNDRVDSLEWAHSGCRFASGSRDGLAKVWKFSCGKWRSTSLIVPGFEPTDSHPAALASSERPKSKYRVTMLCWSLDDSMIVTAGSDYILRVWSSSGGLLRCLPGHTDDIFVLKAHPSFSNAILSCGHDGVMVFWDLNVGDKVKKFTNTVEHRGHSALFDLDISRDGCTVAAVDSLGHLTIYSVASKSTRPVPKQQFFNTDYSPLLMDDTGWVLDEATGIAPQLLPPPLLTDQDLVPLADEWQDTVPGRDLLRKNPNGGSEPFVSAWISRLVVPPLSVSERNLWCEEMSAVADLENEEFETELLKEPAPEPEPIDAIIPLTSSQRKAATRYRGSGSAAAQLAGREGSTNRRRRPPTLEEAIAAQDARRAAAEMENYQSDMDDSYSNSESSSNDGSSDSDTSDSDYAVRARNRNQDRDEEQEDEEEEEEITPPEVTTSSGRRVQRPQRRDGAKHKNARAKEPRRRVRIAETEDSSATEMRSPEVEEDETDATDIPSVSDAAVPVKKPSRQRKKKESFLDSFPDWMRMTEPRRFPFVAQLGDHVVYFRQGHEMYLERVEATNLYPISSKMRPKPSLGAEEFCIIDEVRYVRKPYRLTVVRLSQTDREGQRTGVSWSVKFHDLANVPDFIILKQHYDLSIAQNVQEGDRIEAILDGQWWTGTVDRKEPKSEEFPSSLWFCLRIIWDSGEEDLMSPWDCQPRSGSRKSGDEATEADHLAFAFFEPDDDWPESDFRGAAEAKELCCARMADAIVKLSVRDTVEPFAYPVSLEAFPHYAANIDYPIDLDTIANRIRSGFYRRLKSLHQDIRCIAVAAEQFNEPSSAIVRNSRIVVEALIRFSRDPLIDDVVNLYDSLFDLPSDQIVEYCKRQLPKLGFDDELLKHLAEVNPVDTPPEPGWKTDCRAIMQSVMADPCATHFLKADAATNEDLAAALHQTCDLTSLLESLERGDIDQPATLLHDVEKMVHACKTNLDDKRSPIYRDSLALGSLFAERMRGVLSQFERIWKSLIDPGGRSLRRRSRKERIQSKYNTRSHDRDVTSTFDPQQPSTSHSGRLVGNSPGFYRDLANGRLTSEPASRRSAGRRSPVSANSVSSPLVPSQSSRPRRNVASAISLVHAHDTSGISDDSAPSTSSREAFRSRRVATRRRQLLSSDSAGSPPRNAPSMSSARSSVVRSDEEPVDDKEEHEEEEDDSPQNDDLSEYEEEEPQPRPRVRPKRKARQPMGESETASLSERRSNGHYSMRSSNPSKRRRIESDSDHEAPRSRRGRNTRRNVAAINYVESDEDSAPDVPNISSRGRIRRPRRPVHF